MNATENDFSEAIDYLDSLREWLVELGVRAPETPEQPQFKVGDKVVVWATGHRFCIGEPAGSIDFSTTPPRYYVPQQGQFVEESALLAIPTKPPDGKGYEVGEWKKIDDGDAGWLDRSGCQNWFDTPSCIMPMDEVDHGYRFPLARVPEPKFQDGACVVIGPNGCDPGLIVAVVGKPRIESGETQYLVEDANTQVRWERESDLELESETDEAAKATLPQIADLHAAHIDITGGQDSVDYVRQLRDADEAPRQKPPDTPPPYKGPDGEVAMRWVRREDGEVAVRPELKGEYYWCESLQKVNLSSYDAWAARTSPICEPVPVVVQGWEHSRICLWLDKHSREVLLARSYPAWSQVGYTANEIVVWIDAKDLPLRTDIEIPEVGHE